LLVFFYHDTGSWRSLKGIVMTFFVGCGVLLGVLLGIFIFYPMLRVVFYWSATTPDVLMIAVQMTVLVAGLVFVGWVGKVPGVEMLKAFSRFMLMVGASCALGIAAVIVTSSMVLTYPPEVGQLIRSAWSGFRDSSVFWLSIPIVTAISIYTVAERKIADLVPAVRTLPPLTRKRTKPTIFARSREFVRKRDVRTFLKALGLILLISFMLVPLDQKLALFAPTVSAGQERPYVSHGCPTLGHLILVRLANGTNRFYQVMKSTYRVTIPYVRHLVDQVYVANPSNFSGTSQDPSRTSSDSDILWAQGSNGVSLALKGSPGPVTAIIANLTMVSDRMANFTVFYSQEFLRRNVTVDAQPRRIDAASHTYVYSFLFTDNEDVCAIVSRIELSELSRGEVNSTGVKVYVEGSESHSASVGVDGVILNAGYLYSGRTMNVTLVLPMKET